MDDRRLSELAGIPVSRETMERLRVLVALAAEWQRAENLVAPGTLPAIWTRHVADSAQLLHFFPKARIWLDIGSGGGFPGLVVACLLAGPPASAVAAQTAPAGAPSERPENAVVHLVESNRRKGAFLRRAAAATGAPAEVHEVRAEDAVAGWSGRLDIVTARAVAPLSRLLPLIAPLVTDRTRAALHKGRDFAREIAEASQYWTFDLVQHGSRIDAESVILEISRLVPRRP